MHNRQIVYYSKQLGKRCWLPITPVRLSEVTKSRVVIFEPASGADDPGARSAPRSALVWAKQTAASITHPDALGWKSGSHVSLRSLPPNMTTSPARCRRSSDNGESRARSAHSMNMLAGSVRREDAA
jgi:hypothetical protein